MNQITTTRESVIRRFIGNLRFPQLFLLAGGLFLADLVIPDMIPFGDEIFLGILTALLASFKSRRAEGAPPAAPPPAALPPSGD